jgi:hypothetical protein
MAMAIRIPRMKRIIINSNMVKPGEEILFTKKNIEYRTENLEL